MDTLINQVVAQLELTKEHSSLLINLALAFHLKLLSEDLLEQAATGMDQLYNPWEIDLKARQQEHEGDKTDYEKQMAAAPKPVLTAFALYLDKMMQLPVAVQEA